MKLYIALVGRENVGKSSIFNKLIPSKQKAIVHNKPGVTVDFNIASASFGNIDFAIIDTPGGIKSFNRIKEFNAANAFILVIDNKCGILPEDQEIIKEIRKTGYPFFILVNKCDAKTDSNRDQYYELSPDHFFVSATQNTGFYQIEHALQKMQTQINKSSAKDISGLKCDLELETTIKIAILGKPNAGKSTFINKLIKQNRLLVSSVPGTTVDAIHIPFKYKDQDLVIIDTAGLRKKSKIENNSLEGIVTKTSIRSINLADICILMLDITETLTKQDWNIINTIYAKDKSVILVFNKIDLLDDLEFAHVKKEITYQADKMAKCYILFISCKENFNLIKPIDTCIQINKLYIQKISTHALNKWLKTATSHRNPVSSVQGKIIKLKYCNRICIKPIIIQIFSNYPQYLNQNYTSYLQNHFIKYFDLKGAVIKLKFTKTKNPYMP